MRCHLCGHDNPDVDALDVALDAVANMKNDDDFTASVDGDDLAYICPSCIDFLDIVEEDAEQTKITKH